MWWRVTALYRRGRRAVTQYGFWPTVARALRRPVDIMSRVLRGSYAARRRSLAIDEEFDRTYGVETTKDGAWKHLAGNEHPNWMHGTPYQATPSVEFRRFLDDLTIDYRDFVFVDFGSGKGRTLLQASEYPFKAVVGVEYSQSLHDVAQQNIDQYQSSTRNCEDVRSVCADASAYPIPDGPAVLYFNNPFGEVLMRRVVESIRQSLSESERRLIVIYRIPVCRDLFAVSPFVERRRYGRNCLVYEVGGTPSG